MQKVKVRKWLTLKEKMKVVDEVKRPKPVMDVARVWSGSALL